MYWFRASARCGRPSLAAVVRMRVPSAHSTGFLRGGVGSEGGKYRCCGPIHGPCQLPGCVKTLVCGPAFLIGPGSRFLDGPFELGGRSCSSCRLRRSPRRSPCICKKYSDGSISMVRNQPCRPAVDVWGIGFLTTAKIAHFRRHPASRIPHDSPEPVKVGQRYALSQPTDQGNCYLPAGVSDRRASKLLQVNTGPVIDAEPTRNAGRIPSRLPWSFRRGISLKSVSGHLLKTIRAAGVQGGADQSPPTPGSTRTTSTPPPPASLPGGLVRHVSATFPTTVFAGAMVRHHVSALKERADTALAAGTPRASSPCAS
ncbi:helix-hairpin-helix domain-containing protein [Streptomyces sp. NPDC055243]|uniref:helix-hairpin-helix domain-containing protein n=1 Tax=Streptomyces sp. NPDC055243 TaxID=3365720 RepID=UPI0037D8D6BC